MHAVRLRASHAPLATTGAGVEPLLGGSSDETSLGAVAVGVTAACFGPASGVVQASQIAAVMSMARARRIPRSLRRNGSEVAWAPAEAIEEGSKVASARGTSMMRLLEEAQAPGRGTKMASEVAQASETMNAEVFEAVWAAEEPIAQTLEVVQPRSIASAKVFGMARVWVPSSDAAGEAREPRRNLPEARNEARPWSIRTAMQTITFESFDPSFYQRMGRLDIIEVLALCRALLELCPKGVSAQLDRIADKLAQLVSEGEAMLTARRRESVPSDHSFEMWLDALADSLWSLLRNRLDGWGVFEHRAMTGVLQAHARRSSVAVALSLARKKAERARALSVRLFGAEGLAFIRLPYPAQAQSMASILRLIEEDDLAFDIDELAGPEIMIALVACQAQYEAMVKARLSRADRRSVHFGILGGKLRRLLARYVGAVLTLLDEDDPESLDVVVAALQPIEVLRTQLSRGVGRSEAVVVESAEDDESADEPAVA